jgi:hypothetical protein
MSEEQKPVQHEIEVSPSGRKYSRKQYTVTVEDTTTGKRYQKKIRLDITPQVRPAGDIQPAPFPSFEEQAARASYEATEGVDALLAATALHAMRQTPTDEQPLGEVETFDPLAANAANSIPLFLPEYSRDDAMNVLTKYLGAKLDGEDVLNDEGVKLYLADNLGTLISSLDNGTEEYVAALKASAKHPRFYFREGVSRAHSYLETVEGLLKRFPWRYAADTPSQAITDLRKAQGFIGYAIAAITGRGSEAAKTDQYDEDGVVPYNPPGAPTIRPLEEMIASAERVVRALKAFKEKRDEGITTALERAPNELRKVAAEEAKTLTDYARESEGPHPLAAEERYESVNSEDDFEIVEEAEGLSSEDFKSLVKTVESELEKTATERSDDTSVSDLVTEYSKLSAHEQEKHYLAVKQVIYDRTKGE